VPKHDILLEAYGTVDELNAAIGLALADAKQQSVIMPLRHVQNDLFIIGALLASAGAPEKVLASLPALTSIHLQRMEDALASIESTLPQQTSFILPRGNRAAASLHLARTICRRAERRVCALQPDTIHTQPLVIQYLNRLSDLLFLCARLESGEDEPVTYG